ncbi:MAG TPA: AAA family ATPase [Usitatibacter sp.]|nr:AAA family ATPase [Usitatibacter sp.]
MAHAAPRLLEREGALQALEAAWGRAQAAGCVAMVSGEAGIGKTSLVTAFTESLGERAFVAFGRCDALFTPRVLGPVHDIAARLGGGLAEKLGGNRSTAFTAVLDQLKKARAPVVVFEDMHWADEATLDLVKFLGRRIGDTRALLVLTYRDDEVPPRHPLRLVLGELPRERLVRVGLVPLTLAAVEMLVAPSAATRPRPGAQFASQLHAATAGNPFYISEILASGEGVPEGVRDAVLARAARLGPQARAVADLVSVAPGGLEASIVEESLPDAPAAMAECEERGILRSAGGLLHFRHEIARLAILDALSSRQRRLLDGQVLEALRRRGIAGEQLARLAHHAEAAEDAKGAHEYSTAAGKRASELAAHREAAEHFARALRFSQHLDARERAGLLDAFAWECQVTGRTEAVECRKEAAALWRKVGDARREVESLARLSHVLVVQGRDAEAETPMQEAFRVIEGLPPGEAHLIVYRFHAYLRMLERDVEVAIADGERALELAERFGADEDRAHVLNTLGSSLLVADDERGIVLLERSLEISRARGLDYHVSNAYGNLGSACGEVHRFRQALAYLEEGVAWSRAHDLDNSYFYESSWLALAQLFLGRWSDAAETAQNVLRSASASVISRIMALLATGRLRARRGDPGAWEALDEALALAEETTTLQRLAPVRAARAEAAWLAGEDAAAAREATAAFELSRRKRHAWFVGELAYWQWKGGRAVEMPQYAARPYALQVAGRWQDAAEDWRERGCPYEEARALAEGDAAARLAALRIFDDLGARPASERVRQSLRAAGVKRIPRGPRASTRALPAGLTTREVQVLGLIAEGLTNAEVAGRLHISTKTVDHHVSAVLAKLGVDSRREAIRVARASNWVGPPDVVKG